MTAGYSGTPLATKLGVKSGHRFVVLGAPQGWGVEHLPESVTVSRRRSVRKANVLVAFFAELASMRRDAEGLAHAIVADGALWIAWPRKAAGHVSDITENVIREVFLPLGVVDVKVAALDEDWSGLKLVWRKERRADLE
jgi:hypothetical protein